MYGCSICVGSDGGNLFLRRLPRGREEVRPRVEYWVYSGGHILPSGTEVFILNAMIRQFEFRWIW